MTSDELVEGIRIELEDIEVVLKEEKSQAVFGCFKTSIEISSRP
jgi:hypothetical protein